MTSVYEAAGHVRISLVGGEFDQSTVSDLGLFIYDFATIYELGRLATDPHYERFRFSRFALYRNGRPLKRQDQMNLERVRSDSPVELFATIALAAGAAGAVAGAIWTIVQTVDKIYNLPLNRRKLQLEVKKLEREGAETQSTDTTRIIGPDEAMRILERREALQYVDKVRRRLMHSPIQVREVDVEVVNPLPDDSGKPYFKGKLWP